MGKDISQRMFYPQDFGEVLKCITCQANDSFAIFPRQNISPVLRFLSRTAVHSWGQRAMIIAHLPAFGQPWKCHRDWLVTSSHTVASCIRCWCNWLYSTVILLSVMGVSMPITRPRVLTKGWCCEPSFGLYYQKHPVCSVSLEGWLM